MTVKELIEKLKECDPESRVYIDWDREGGNEVEVTRIQRYNANEWQRSLIPPKDIALR
jgi:hypothetical protein